MKVEKARGRPSGKKSQLNQDLIIYMAKALMREQGKVPSIRGIARALDVDSMAIYHYFDNKNSLLTAILVSLMDSIYCPPKQQHWQEALLLLSESYLNLLSHYAGLLEILTTMPEAGPISVFTTRFNKIIDPLNVPAQKQQCALSLLLNLLHGQVLLSTNKTAIADEDFKRTFSFYCELLMQYE